MGGEEFKTLSQVIRWHLVCILTGVHCGYEIFSLRCPMMYSGVVLGEIVWQIMLSVHTIYQKLSLPDSIYDPVKSHFDGSWTSLADAVIEKSVSCGAVHYFWGGWLGVAHIYERRLCRCDSLSVYQKGSQFCFHYASKDVSHGSAFDMNWSIECWLLEGGPVGIFWCRSKVMISSRSDLGLRICQEGGVTVDV